MQMRVAPLLEIVAQTRTLRACLAWGFRACFFPDFTLIVWLCRVSCIELLSDHITFSKVSLLYRHIFAKAHLLTLFWSEFIGPKSSPYSYPL